MKKLSIFLLALFASAGITQAAIVDGSCGDNLTWSLNTKDSTLTITGSGEMTNWYGESPWYEYDSYIKYVSLPDGLTSIGDYAFFVCSSLTSVTIPNSVTSIGEYAFSSCFRLTSVTIPNSVKNIGGNAFNGCTGLTSVTIGNSVTSIGDYAFSDCKIKNIIFSGTMEQWVSKSWYPIDISSSYSLSINDVVVTNAVIPNSVKNIRDNAFNGCSSLTSVTIGNSVTSIGQSAFSRCTGLTSVEIPNSVTSIGSGAFEYCTSLTSVTIPNSVTSIGDRAFNGCTGLTSIEIPSSVTSIGSSALPSSLQRLTVYATTPPSANNAGVDRNTCKLYVPAESVEAYANALWWEDFASIRAIGSGFIVKFLDWSGTVLSSQEVDSGEDAIAPANPTREGYTFIGWDKEFINITEDLVVKAQYQINRFEVVFKDWDGTVLKSDSVDWNTAAIAPTNPSREGYTFIGWDKEFSQVTENMTITAQYELGENKTVTVIFANGNDESAILSQQLTMKVPSAPSISGFTFLGWYPVASVFAEPENTITIQAVYQADEPSSAPAVYTNPANPAQKLIRNGNVYILTEDKTYTITGQMVK